VWLKIRIPLDLAMTSGENDDPAHEMESGTLGRPEMACDVRFFGGKYGDQ
jgi:hypothetical protein